MRLSEWRNNNDDNRATNQSILKAIDKNSPLAHNDIDKDDR